MDRKKLIVQVSIAMVLFVVISLVLEGSFTLDVLREKIIRGLIFGLIYGVFLWIRARWIHKK
jgi:NhaP-type Na+/H+ or K+/H+ antiporter